MLFGHHDPHRPGVRVDDLTVHDLVLHPADPMDAVGVLTGAHLRLLGHLGLRDQGTGRRIPPGELDAGGLPDHAASAVAPDEILGPQRLALGQLDVDAGVVLRKARHLASAMDGHRQLVDPAGQDAFDVVLPQPEHVGVPGGEVADVQRDAGEPRDLGNLSLGEEPVGDPALIEDLDGACVQPTCARAGQVPAGAPLDDRHVDARQRQLARQHQPRRASPGNHHCMLGHHCIPVPRLVLRPAILRHHRGLAASPPVRYTLEMEGSGAPFLSFVRLSRRASSGGRRPGGR